MTPTLAFGDDRSPGAELCWDWISAHGWDGWRLEVITAEPIADMHPIPPEDAELHPWQPDEPRDGAGLGFESVQHLTAEIDPRVSLISKPWDLVAIGPQGSGDSDNLGSTAEWLLREPASPLVVARQPGPVRSALVAADGSPHVIKAVDALISLPWIGEIEVVVVSVRERKVDPASALEAVTERLTSAAGVDQVTLQGRTAPALLGEIEKRGPDLVVMGVRGRGPIGRLVIGSTTKTVSAALDRSILVAHAASDV